MSKIFLRVYDITQSPFGFDFECLISVHVSEGMRKHFIAKKCIDGDLVECSIIEEEGDFCLIDLPYSCDPFRGWVYKSDLTQG